MTGLSLLDVAIAMIFFFLLLSLVCSAANEIFAALLQTRAKFLERGIKRLLSTPEFAIELFKHPLIKSLEDEIDPVFKKLHSPLPSYIPSRTFALAMVDLMNQNMNAANGPNVPVPADVGRAMEILLDAAGKDAAKVQECIEEWYDNAMDRVSGAYKRRVQYVSFVLGMIVAIVMNADTVALVERLSTNKILSASVADAAAQYTKVTQPSKADNVDEARTTLHKTLSTLDHLELPLGWAGAIEENTLLLDKENVFSAIWRLMKTHLVGWLMTSLAISFGAPFWFDMLNRVMVVRSSVKPQERSQPGALQG